MFHCSYTRQWNAAAAQVYNVVFEPTDCILDSKCWVHVILNPIVGVFKIFRILCMRFVHIQTLQTEVVSSATLCVCVSTISVGRLPSFWPTLYGYALGKTVPNGTETLDLGTSSERVTSPLWTKSCEDVTSQWYSPPPQKKKNQKWVWHPKNFAHTHTHRTPLQKFLVPPLVYLHITEKCIFTLQKSVPSAFSFTKARTFN